MSTPPTPPRPPSRLLRGFSALRVRNYRLYWFGQLVSMTGSWVQATAQALLVLQLTSEPLAVGLVATFQFLPVMLFSLFGGVIADRVPRYRMILSTQVIAMILAIIFGSLVGLGIIQLWQVYLLALLQGFVNALDAPVRQAFAIELVGKEDRSNAVALNSIVFNGSRIIGPAMAGILIGPLGIASMLYMNAASFMAMLIGLLLMDTRLIKNEQRPPQPVLRQLREGLAYTWRTPEVLLVMILMAAIGTFGYNFSVMMPLIGGFVLHTDAVSYGMLGTFLGLGSLAAALANAYMRTFTPQRMIVSAMAFSLLLGALSRTTQLPLALGLLFALGFAGISFTTAANTTIQLRVPDHLRGRVSSLYFTLFAGSTPIGGLLIGGAANVIGVPNTLLLCATLCLLGVGAGTLYQRRTLHLQMAHL
ncbi:major facilitator superfamily MFS_1 [Oscillochloris trichoides DG-6]|uniref:Major facilitator superfamily MFS_1 n=1 Tax=Oscillochloris trichoides DG-6 TaxID=765420 RepID=E1II73_9CHLR|nr:MFS transporter [Oscillochloris trichoides]EFO79101.1 major facilitator superfamily MFS_1 [Oscillochloris trichoides DG-6]